MGIVADLFRRIVVKGGRSGYVFTASCRRILRSGPIPGQLASFGGFSLRGSFGVHASSGP